MSRIRFAAGVSVAAAVLVMTTSNWVAQASTPAIHNSAASAIEQQVRGLLHYNPGARRIDADSVELEKGVVVEVHLNTGAAELSAAHARVSPSLCSVRHGALAGWLCLYQDPNFKGSYIDFSACGEFNLANYRMDDGRPWYDEISSIDNDQTRGVQSRFYNFDGSGDPNSPANWRPVVAVNAGDYLRDLRKNRSADGGNADNKIDIVHVC